MLSTTTVCNKQEKRAHLFMCFPQTYSHCMRSRPHRYDDGWKWNNGTGDKHDHFLQLYIKLDLWNIILYLGSCALACHFIPSVQFFFFRFSFCHLFGRITFRVFAMHLALFVRFHVIKYDNGSFSVRNNLLNVNTASTERVSLK